MLTLSLGLFHGPVSLLLQRISRTFPIPLPKKKAATGISMYHHSAGAGP